MKRKRVLADATDHANKLRRFMEDPSDADLGAEAAEKAAPSADRVLFTLDHKRASRLLDGFAKQRRKAALQEIVASSQSKGVTYPAALQGPDGVLVDMTTLVVHTGARFLSRADLCSPSSSEGTRTLCPPGADESTTRFYNSEATSALLAIMNGSPPASLPLEAIAGLLEQAQYFGAVFVVTMLPYYLQPLSSQLNAAQASAVLAQSLSAVQGTEAMRAYKELAQALAPAIASLAVSVDDFAAAAGHILTAARALCAALASGSRSAACEVQDLLLQLAISFAEFEHSVSVEASKQHQASDVPAQVQESLPLFAAARYDVSEALLGIVLAAAASTACFGGCDEAAQLLTERKLTNLRNLLAAGPRRRTSQ